MISLDIYKSLESTRWNSETDIPWDQFDDSITDIQARWIRNTCLAEFSTAPGTAAFLRDFTDDPDFASFMGLWLFEEQKHMLAHYEYLKRFRPHLIPTDEHIQNVNLHFEPVPNRYCLLFLHHCEELDVASIYSNAAKDITEPVYKKILQLIAADESRHSRIFFTFCQRYLEKDYARAVDGYTKVAMFLTSGRTHKHPTANIVNTENLAAGSVQSRKPEPDLYAKTWSPSLQNLDPSILINKYLSSLSKLLDHEFRSAKDILKYRRNLKLSEVNTITTH